MLGSFVCVLNLSQSAFSFETCVIIPFVYFGLHSEGKNPLQCLSTVVWLMQKYRYIGLASPGNENHRYRPKKTNR